MFELYSRKIAKITMIGMPSIKVLMRVLITDQYVDEEIYTFVAVSLPPLLSSTNLEEKSIHYETIMTFQVKSTEIGF